MKMLYYFLVLISIIILSGCDSKKAEKYLYEGNQKFQQNDFKGAEELYTNAIKAKPDYAEAYKQRGRARYNQKETKGALNDFTKAIEFDKNMAEAYYNRGTIYFYMNEVENACKDFRKAKELKYPYVDENYKICNYYN